MKTTFVNLVFLDVYIWARSTPCRRSPRSRGGAPESVLAVMTAGTQQEAIEATLKAASAPCYCSTLPNFSAAPLAGENRTDQCRPRCSKVVNPGR